MAIVKLNYTRKIKTIKAHLRYITHRPGKEGERTKRSLFDREGQKEKNDAYRMFDEAGRGTIFFKLVISPDPKKEDVHKDLDLWKTTSQTISRLEERLGTQIRFIAAEHNDHTPNRHVHAIFLLKQKLTREDLSALRAFATESAGLNRQSRDLAAGQIEKHQRLRGVRMYSQKPKRAHFIRHPSNRHYCQHCIAFYPLRRVGKTLFECSGCNALYRDQIGISQALQEVGWEL